MENFDAVRRLARAKYCEARPETSAIATAASLLDAAAQLTGIHREPVSAGDALLQGGEAILVPSAQSIFYNASVDPALAVFYQAHEFAHHWLDDAAAGACSAKELNVSAPEERAPLGLQRVEGYGPRERRETQANVFAREFLLPAPEARRLYLDQHLGATEIAAHIGVPVALAYQQLGLALLVPELTDDEPEESEPRQMPALDDSQREAAEADNGPLLLEAGPGTGKTRTLVSRIETLLKRGVDPTHILALTFSNKAAGEMRERVNLSSPAAAAAIWAGTFHAFGLEILRKWAHLIAIPKDVRLVDPSDALLMLETELPSLPLNHYLRLSDPALDLQHILSAISRAKDELVTPAAYRAYGERMLASAGTDDDARLAAEKVLEVAAIYEAYEALLRRAQVVDFPDLINRSIELLDAHPAALTELRERYQHVLVDEYQDVNRASAVLLKQIAGDGTNLWVVGDARQSIYRFRGASPANIRQFDTDFPGSRRLALDTNYRSQQHVVRLVEAFAPRMRASVGGLPAQWQAKRGAQGGKVLMEIASDLAAEAAGLALEIERQRKQGIPYRDQAILCRSHTQLARFAALLEAQGIPILYLGDLFERPEIRDLLSLLSLLCEPERGGLLRVASFPEYLIPLVDVRAVLAFAELAKCDPVAALRRLAEVDNLTKSGCRGLECLASHLAGIDIRTPPAWFLSSYLFDRSRYLATLLADAGVAGQQRRLAIYQLLQFALEYDAAGQPLGGDPKRRLLRWIRRLEILGDERQLRQMPAAANGIDAVRMMTVHASKGLEFDAVYLPGLGTQIFPLSPRYNPCPPPTGMLPDDPADAHEAEEQCLFFVAMSRARDVLCLSRAERYSNARRTAASALLLEIASHLPSSPEGSPRWQEAGPRLEIAAPVTALARAGGSHAAEDLDQYLRCPRQYLYQRILDLSGAREDTAYVSFHRCVYHVLRWINHRSDGTPFPAAAQAIAELEVVWAERGPTDHPYNGLYWAAALDIIQRAVNRGANASTSSAPAIWDIPRAGGGSIRLRPDHVEITQGGVTVRRLRTGRPPKKVVIDPIYALYHAGAEAAHPGARIQIETHFLTADESVPIVMKPKMIGDRLEKYDDAIAGIAAGHFPADPKDERACPRCPQYFICAGLPPLDATADSEDES
jgi:DNA helicase II / ATP-dependent DNA helicase PcrA